MHAIRKICNQRHGSQMACIIECLKVKGRDVSKENATYRKSREPSRASLKIKIYFHFQELKKKGCQSKKESLKYGED